MNNAELLINSKSRLVILTGAGLSAESGIPTFRAADGLWENHRVEDVASPEGFRRNPELVLRFYNERRAHAAQCQPNPGHKALAELQALLGEERCILITQNVDDLLERAGVSQLIHMHGELNQARCRMNSSHLWPWLGEISEQDRCPTCNSRLRPHIVWFGEIPLQMDEIEDKLQNCTHFLSIGTSGQVYPAAGFKHLAQHHGARTLHFNLNAEAEGSWDQQILGASGETLPEFVAQVKKALAEE